MDVKAIILAGAEDAVSGVTPLHRFAGLHPALLDVLGRPVVHTVIDRLFRFGIDGVSVVVDDHPDTARVVKRIVHKNVDWEFAPAQQLWRAAENAFCNLAQAGAELVVVLRLGAYAEIDYEALLQFHIDQRARVTPVCRSNGSPLDTFVISASRRNDAAFLFRHQLKSVRTPCTGFVFSGYVNELRDLRELRCLAIDGLLMRNEVVPAGLQVRPGVWVASGARIQRGARILAPAFIGERAKVRSTAVVTRCSTLEHHCEVDCGSVVEDASVLPYSYVGAGLDVSHAVVGYKSLAHLRRNIVVQIADSKLIGMASPYAALRTLGNAASLLTFLPKQAFRGLFGTSPGEAAASFPAAVQAPSPAINTPPSMQASADGEASQYSNLTAVRRYGNE
jgi:NDP-sugar pyrophosphorylase family protein